MLVCSRRLSWKERRGTEPPCRGKCAAAGCAAWHGMGVSCPCHAPGVQWSVSQGCSPWRAGVLSRAGEPRPRLLQSVCDRDALPSIWAGGARARPLRRMLQVLVPRFCVSLHNNVPVSKGILISESVSSPRELTSLC